MKYAKLVEMEKKAHKYCVVSNIAVCVLCILLLICVFCLWAKIVTPTLLSIVFVVAFVGIAVMLRFTSLQGRQKRYEEDYFAIRIMEVLNEQGIETEKFELIQETQFCYRVGFHNQMIDYEKLQAIIDEEVNAMNKIMNGITKVKLI